MFYIYRYDSSAQLLCKRVQIPIILCFATTVHKSQGLTAQWVEVHADDMFYPSLLAVAISRASRPDGLRLIGFSKRSIIPPAKALIEALKTTSTHPIDEMMSCCIKKDDTVNDNTFDYEMSDDDDEEEEPFCTTSEEITPISSTSAASHACNTSTVQELLKKQLFNVTYTEQQKQINSDINYLINSYNLTSVHQFLLETLEAAYTSILHNSIKRNDSNTAIFNDFVAKADRFIQTELTARLSEHHEDLNSRYHPYIRQLYIHMYLHHLEEESKLCAQTTIATEFKDAQQQPSTSAAGLGTIRRIGGRTLYKMRKEIFVRMAELPNADILSLNYLMFKKISKAIHSLTASADEVEKGRYPQTALQTERRNYRAGGLTHISDNAFELFCELEKSRIAIQTIGRGLVNGSSSVG